MRKQKPAKKQVKIPAAAAPHHDNMSFNVPEYM